jgi:hypothetical protein
LECSDKVDRTLREHLRSQRRLNVESSWTHCSSGSETERTFLGLHRALPTSQHLAKIVQFDKGMGENTDCLVYRVSEFNDT